MKRAFLSVCAAVMLCFGVIAATAGEIINSVGRLEDPGGLLTIHDVSEMSFTPAGLMHSEGYSASTFWYKIEIREEAGPFEPLLILKNFAIADAVLFKPSRSRQGGWLQSARGTLHRAEASRWYPSGHTFQLTKTDLSQPIYLRIRSHGAVYFGLSAVYSSGQHVEASLTGATQVYYLSIMLALFLWSWMFQKSQELRLFRLFSIHQGVWIVQNVFFFGYPWLLFPYLDPTILDWLLRLLVSVSGISLIILHTAIFVRFRAPRLWITILRVQLALMVVALLLLMLGQARLGLFCALSVAATLPVSFIGAAFGARPQGGPSKRLFRICYFAIALNMWTWVPYMLGVDSFGFVISLRPMFNGFLTGIAVYMFLTRTIEATALELEDLRRVQTAADEKRKTELEASLLQQQFIDLLAHETRNVLSVVTMTLGADTLTDQKRARVGTAISGLQEIVARWGKSVWLTNDTFNLHREPCHPGAILASICRDSTDSARIHLAVDERDSFSSDATALDLVFSNLVQNAVSYSPQGTPITIHVAISKEIGLAMTIENECHPLRLPDKDRIFSRFYRHPSSLSVPGTGLGLSVVSALVKAMKGQITHEQYGTTVRFRLFLPC